MSPDPPSRRAHPADARFRQWTAADGWPLRILEREGAGQGTILFAGGLGDFIEKYLEPLDEWHRAGWRIVSLDWRGQGRSGRLGPRRVAHVESFEAHVDDAAALIAELRGSAPGPLVAIGHSMGGHIFLRAMAEGKARPDAAVLVAPMLGLHTGPVPEALAHWLARARVLAGQGRNAAWDPDKRLAFTSAARQRVLTGCRERYGDEGWWRETDPELGLGPPSWGWLAAAFVSTRGLARQGGLERVDLPILLLATRRDRLVDTRAIEAAAVRMPRAEILILEGAGHEILREADTHRLPAMRAIAGFLDRAAPPR